MLSKDILQEFEDLTKYPIISYFESFSIFTQTDYQQITNYYSGNSLELNAVVLKNLETLISSTNTLLEIFKSHKKTLNNLKWWDLLEQVEKIDTKLLSIKNISKWLRTVIGTSTFNPNPEINISFRQGQTLESLNRDLLGSQDWNNNWQDLAIKNNLREEDYSPEGGKIIKANVSQDSAPFIITSIVDNPQGNKVLGIDINKKLRFVDNDLEVLSPEDTFLQSVNIKTVLRKGDIPEFPTDGINPKLVIGNNLNSIAYPILFRQLSDLFKKDDTISSFSITNINRVQDGLYIDFEVRNRLGEIQTISQII